MQKIVSPILVPIEILPLMSVGTTMWKQQEPPPDHEPQGLPSRRPKHSRCFLNRPELLISKCFDVNARSTFTFDTRTHSTHTHIHTQTQTETNTSKNRTHTTHTHKGPSCVPSTSKLNVRRARLWQCSFKHTHTHRDRHTKTQTRTDTHTHTHKHETPAKIADTHTQTHEHFAPANNSSRHNNMRHRRVAPRLLGFACRRTSFRSPWTLPKDPARAPQSPNNRLSPFFPSPSALRDGILGLRGKPEASHFHSGFD